MVVGTAIGMVVDAHGPIGSRIYPVRAEGMPEPTGLQMAALMMGTLAQAVGLGVALALVVGAGRAIAALERALPGRRRWVVASFVGLVWILGSWIPHVGLHQAIDPTDLWALTAIEWGFHVTVVAAGCVLARYVYLLAEAAPSGRAHEGAGFAAAPQA